MGTLILVTNDDGIESAGLWQMARALRRLGDVVIACPDRDYSGSSASVAMQGSIACRAVPGPLKAYALCAPPAACVWAGVRSLLPRRPDLVVSGINNGPNLGRDRLISGTVGAALFAGALGIPGLAVSTDLGGNPDWQAPVAAAVAAAREMLAGQDPEPLVVNLNVPAGPRVVNAMVTRPSSFSTVEMVDLELRHDGGTLRLVPVLQPRPPKAHPEGTDMFAYMNGISSVSLLEPRPAPAWALERAEGLAAAVACAEPVAAVDLAREA